MTSILMKVLAAFLWLAALVSMFIYYGRGGNTAIPEITFQFYFALTVLSGIAVYLAAGWIADFQARRHKTESQDEKREKVIREAEEATRMGRHGTALLIYEAAGMYSEALQIAQKIGDRFAMARIRCSMKSYDLSRRLYLEIGDFEAAGNVSLLMVDELENARDYYRKAAENPSRQRSLSEEGALWERAGEKQKAADTYEQAGEMGRAAECYEIIGDMKNSKRCAIQWEAICSYRRKEEGLNRELQERISEGRRKNDKAQAQKLKQIGDFFASAILFREAGDMMEAAQCFEHCGEWERAAKAYEEAQLPDRAAIARAKIPPRPTTPDEQDEENPASKPLTPPNNLADSFAPIQQPQAVPVYLAAAGIEPASAEARLNVCRRVRRGNFLEAAEFAREARDWLMAAAYYEKAEQYILAADIYRQIGDASAAAWCLEKCGRYHEAALLCLSAGMNVRVTEILLKAISAGGEDARKNGITLAELLIKWGKHKLGAELLRTRVFENGINKTNSATIFKFARMLEERQALLEAHDLYNALQEAGALSGELDNREKKTAEQLKTQQLPANESTGQPTDEIETKVLAFLRSPSNTAKRNTEGEITANPFPLQTEEAQSPDNIPEGEYLQPDLSLFGHAVGDTVAVDDEDTGVKTEIDTNKPESASGKKNKALSTTEDNPFLPARRYLKQKELGRGGMGIVYRTQDTLLNRPVALKLIRDELADSKAFNMFLIEARAVAVLSHPNVVTVYDVGLMDLRLYIAMEYVDGSSLGSLLRRERALPLNEAVRIFLETSLGLQAAHKAGVVHRDIKPDNILLTQQERTVKIADFGLARMRRPTDEIIAGEPYMFSGTPGFMPPEQLRGAEPHPSCDIYALGTTLFTMLVGRAPAFIAGKRSFKEILDYQESADRISLKSLCPNVPETIEHVYNYCVEPDPQKRFRSVEAYLPIVEEFIKTQG